MIESRNNARVKNIIKLKKSGRERKKQKLYVAEGPKMVAEAVRLGLVSEVYVSESAYEALSSLAGGDGGYAGLSPRDAAMIITDTPCEIVSDDIFKELSDTVTPQGILALAGIRDLSAGDVIGSRYGTKHFCDDTACMPVTRVLILEDVRDPGNLGTIIRTAEAAGFNGIIMNAGTADAYNPKVVRSALGAIFRLPFAYGGDICGIISECKDSGLAVYGTHVSGRDMREVEYAPASAFVIGNESKGMSERARELCDENIRIPMNPASESLNAAIAAGIVMYHSSLKFL